MLTLNRRITQRSTGKVTRAEVLVCPECRGERFYVYTQEGVNHVHFQCCRGSACFCDGCHEDDKKAGGG